MKKAAPLLLAALLTACKAPPPASEVPPATGDTASVSSGSADARTTDSQGALANAKALSDAGEHGAAAQSYEEAYRFSPRSREASEALYFAAEESFQAGSYYHSLELFEKLLILYPTTPRYPEVLVRQFQIGKLYVEEKAKKPSWFIGVDKTDTNYGIEVLERFVKQRDQHELAPEALYLVGEAHLRADEPELAIESWQRLVRDYPRSTWARLGEYRIALAFISLSYGPEYDKRPLMTGRKRLKNYCEKYPTGDNYQEAKQKLRELDELLAQHELAIAKNYARRDKHRAAQIYLAAIQKQYPGTNAAAEAKQLTTSWDNPADPAAPEEPK